ncbi:MAG: Zn-dependent oligopeptidase [Candidatus Eremiobacteraeota bacterium]|nr:Zn-dependent oligopeptidase [Candidatus Eremiobacteraeota bacterium]
MISSRTRVLSALSLAFFFATVSLSRPAAATPLGPAHPTVVNWNLSAAQIKTNCKTVISSVDSAVKRILAQRTRRTFANTLVPLENASSDLNDRLVAETFLFEVSPDKPTRDASLQCGTDQSNFFTDLSARPDLYAALVAVRKSGTAKSVYDKKLLQLWMTSLARSGAGLPATKRAEFVRLEKKLTDLQNKYQENLGNDATTITITQAAASGLPSDFIAGLKKNPDGTFVVPVNESTVSLFLENAKDANARKEFYMAYNNRSAGANTTLLQEAIATRDRLAHLMGYPTWAAYQLADKMAQTPQRVTSFLNDLDAKILPKARQEIATLAQLKAQDTGTANATIDPWDVSYYDNMLNKTRYAVDTEAIRQYFPVDHTIDAVLNIYHKLLGVTFVKNANPNVWYPGVIGYDVYDTRSGRFIGSTYFDLYPRPGKYDHFANFPILPVRKMNGTFRAPVAAILGNWPKPAPGHPALLSHSDVVTFFHEFGHNMAALLTTAPYETLSSGFRFDFIEAPSQMLENFVWQPSILKEISSDVTTGAPLPDDLIAKMTAAKYVDYAYFTTRQIMLAKVDMDYHTMGPNVDTTAVWAKVANEDTPMPMTTGIHPQASFGHLMGGYDAGYYGYLWSKVYAQDMFTAFQRGGLESPIVGMRYRNDILAPARTKEPDAEVAAFLGRPMSPTAFYKEFGITVNTIGTGTK